MKRRIYHALRSPALIVLVALALRLGSIGDWRSYQIPADEDHFAFGWENGRVARSIASGQGFSSPLPLPRPTGPTAWMLPVFPYLLASVFRFCGVYTVTSALVMLALNCVFSALTCLTVFLIGLEVSGPTLAVWGSWAWAFFPTVFREEAIGIISDVPLFTFLLSLAFWVVLRLPVRNGLMAWSGCGLLWGLAGLTNETCLLLVPFVLGWLYYRLSQQGIRGRRLVAAAGLSCVFVVTPWLVRDFVVFGQFVLWRSTFGLELRLGNDEDCWGAWSPQRDPALNRDEMEKYRRMGELAYMAEKRREALRLIENRPGCFVRMTARRFLDWWLGSWRPIVMFRLPGQYLVLFNAFFSGLTFLGLRLAIQNHERWAFPFAVVLVVFPLFYYVTYVFHLRPRHPIEPAMVVLALYAVTRVVASLGRRLRTSEPV